MAYTYRSKFASAREAEEWGASTLLQFRSDYFGAGGAMSQALEQLALADGTVVPPTPGSPPGQAVVGGALQA